MSRSTIIVAAAVGLPAAGFMLLLTGPQLDVAWEDHRAHFWLVLAAGAARRLRA